MWVNYSVSFAQLVPNLKLQFFPFGLSFKIPQPTHCSFLVVSFWTLYRLLVNQFCSTLFPAFKFSIFPSLFPSFLYKVLIEPIVPAMLACVLQSVTCCLNPLKLCIDCALPPGLLLFVLHFCFSQHKLPLNRYPEPG